jgi:hypothetical protein
MIRKKRNQMKKKNGGEQISGLKAMAALLRE